MAHSTLKGVVLVFSMNLRSLLVQKDPGFRTNVSGPWGVLHPWTAFVGF